MSSPKPRAVTSWTVRMRGSIHSWKRAISSSSSERVSSWMRGDTRLAMTRLTQRRRKATAVAVTTRATLVTTLICHTEVRSIDWYQR